MKTFTFYNDDPLDCFTVSAASSEEAALLALHELGWSGPCEEEEIEDEESVIEELDGVEP